MTESFKVFLTVEPSGTARQRRLPLSIVLRRYRGRSRELARRPVRLCVLGKRGANEGTNHWGRGLHRFDHRLLL